jgi:hypothetical protein
MIRLGSLAGYAFEGPRLLGGWTPPATPGVYAILYKPDPETRPERYAVIYVGQSDDLSKERFPFRHPAASCWKRRAGSEWKIYICTYQPAGGARPHRELIARELAAVYRPSCNSQQYDRSWQDDWIAGYSAPATTAPLTQPTTGPLTHPKPGPNPSPGPSPNAGQDTVPDPNPGPGPGDPPPPTETAG